MSARDIAPLKYIVAYCPLNSSSITKAMYALNRSLSMQRSLRLSLSLSCVAALALAGTPFQLVSAQEDGSADDFGVMSISLKDVVKPVLGFQGGAARCWNTERSRHWWVLANLCWRQQCVL